MDEQGSMTGEWVPPSPTSKAFFSSYLGGYEQISSGQTPHETRDGSSSFVSHQGMCLEDNKVKEGAASYDNDSMLSSLTGVKCGSRGGLGDRLAARVGFSAPRLDTESIRSNDLPSTDEGKSSYLTIPPGISPTALLESPIFVSNSLTQASPTTGKFPLFQEDGYIRDFFDDAGGSSFAFKPHLEPGLPFALDASNKMGQPMDPQFFRNIEVPAKSENTFQDFISSHVGSNEGLSQSLNEKDQVERNAGPEVKTLYTISGTAEHSPPLSDLQEDEGDQRVIVDPMAVGNVGSQAEDGYNWRKYGQKQVKGSECPRSYYKCTQVNCPVKKKVERSQEGHVTEIIYNGAHNHPKPSLNRRSGFNEIDGTHLENGCDDKGSVWGVAQNGLSHEWRRDSFGHTSLNSMNSEPCNPSLSLQNGALIESGDAVDPSSTFSNDEDEDDRRTHGSVSIPNDGDGDEFESKRRRLETYAAELGSGATRAIREPRVVVQTVSDVDILEDGYRWRKYGQKVVKGNPNPRSYYKCTSVGCTVRKHVERASHDLKSVITTYEGKHNHEVPPARNSSHLNSATSSAFTSQSQSIIPRSEQSQITSMARYGRPLNLSPFNMSMMPPLGPPKNQPTFANFSVAGQGAGMRVNPYLKQPQQRHVNEMGFMMPRGEAKVDPSVHLSNGSSVYHQIMNRLPLGP